MSINSVVLGGVVGRDMEVRFAQNGKAIGNFSLAVTNGWGENKTTTWVNCVVFGERASKLAPHILKGTKLVVNGRLDVRQYDKQDGTKGVSVDVVVNDFEFTGGKGGSNDAGQQQQQQQQQQNHSGGYKEPPMDFDDSIPF